MQWSPSMPNLQFLSLRDNRLSGLTHTSQMCSLQSEMGSLSSFTPHPLRISQLCYAMLALAFDPLAGLPTHFMGCTHPSALRFTTASAYSAQCSFEVVV